MALLQTQQGAPHSPRNTSKNWIIIFLTIKVLLPSHFSSRYLVHCESVWGVLENQLWTHQQKVFICCSSNAVTAAYVRGSIPLWSEICDAQVVLGVSFFDLFDWEYTVKMKLPPFKKRCLTSMVFPLQISAQTAVWFKLLCCQLHIQVSADHFLNYSTFGQNSSSNVPKKRHLLWECISYAKQDN